jgi:outer membrane murein-binding lipoprotein Lpp
MPQSNCIASNCAIVGCPLRRSLVVDGCVRTLRAEELARDVKGLASHNDDLLAVEELLGDGAGEATEQVALAVDDLSGLSARRPMEYL